jgi:hypothetical protein
MGRIANLWRSTHGPSGTKEGRQATVGNGLAFMQAPDRNIQDNLDGLATGYHRQH